MNLKKKDLEQQEAQGATALGTYGRSCSEMMQEILAKLWTQQVLKELEQKTALWSLCKSRQRKEAVIELENMKKPIKTSQSKHTLKAGNSLKDIIMINTGGPIEDRTVMTATEIDLIRREGQRRLGDTVTFILNPLAIKTWTNKRGL